MEGGNVWGGWHFFSKSITLTPCLLERWEYTTRKKFWPCCGFFSKSHVASFRKTSWDGGRGLCHGKRFGIFDDLMLVHFFWKFCKLWISCILKKHFGPTVASFLKVTLHQHKQHCEYQISSHGKDQDHHLNCFS